MNFSKHHIQQLCKEWNIALKKRWGQNFLLHGLTIQRLTELVFDIPECPKKSEYNIWEVGPGMGTVTQNIVIHPCISHLVLFEIDNGLIRFLNMQLKKHLLTNQLSIIMGDAIKTVPYIYAQQLHPPDVIFGNLPYSTGTRMILSWVLAGMYNIPLCVMLQKEAIQRIVAHPHTKLYGIQSVILQSVYSLHTHWGISRSYFYPAPHVDSLICTFIPKKNTLNIEKIKLLIEVVKISFSSRRKMLSNTLKPYLQKWYDGEIFRNISIDFSLRAEQISTSEYCDLIEELFVYKKK